MEFYNAHVNARSRKNYEEGIARAVALATEEELAICRAWHGEAFGRPGFGGPIFVRMEIAKAKKTIEVLDKLRESRGQK